MKDESDEYESGIETNIDQLLEADPSICGLDQFDFDSIEDPEGVCFEFFAAKGHTISKELAQSILLYGIRLAFIAEVSMTEKIMGFCATPPKKYEHSEELLKFIGMKTVIAASIISPATIGDPSQSHIARISGCTKQNVSKIAKIVTNMIHDYRGDK